MTEATNTRREALEELRERCAVMAEDHGKARMEAYRAAKKNKSRQTARDHESMAIEAGHIAVAIRALPLPDPTPQTSDGTGPGSWVPAEQLVQANERIAELEGALALASTRLSIAADKIERGVGRGNSRTGHAIEVRNWSGEALRAKGGAA